MAFFCDISTILRVRFSRIAACALFRACRMAHHRLLLGFNRSNMVGRAYRPADPAVWGLDANLAQRWNFSLFFDSQEAQRGPFPSFSETFLPPGTPLY